MSSSLDKILKLAQKYNKSGFDRVLEKVKIVAAENGRCVAECKVEEEHTNPMGTLHGGFTATMVDTISTYGLRTLLGNKVHVSINMNLSYIKAAKIGDEIVINSETLKVGKSLAFLLVTVKNKQSGDLLVKASHTKYILDKGALPD